MAERTPRTPLVASIRCLACGDLLGRGYPTCDECVDRVDLPLFARWQELLDLEDIEPGSVEERTLAETVVSEKPNKRPWSCVDKALSLLPCPDCRGTLGSGARDCARCAAADAHRWRWSAPDPVQGALRSATVVLRAPHRSRQAVVSTWRLCLPFVLAGHAPTSYERRRISTAVLAGRDVELAAATTLTELAALPVLPWRGVSGTSPGRAVLRVR